MKRIFILLLAVIIPVSIYAQIPPGIVSLEEQINKILNITNTPGCAIAIVQEGKIIYSSGFGYRDYENKIKVDANTIFPIGSATKAFTAALLGQLREKGEISFQESPLKYIPSLKFFNENLNNYLIVEDLLSMRTGLARHDQAWAGIPVLDRDSLLRRIEYLEPGNSLRTNWNYSNFSYFILGSITEKLTRESWESNIRKSLFEPLKMYSSNLGIQGLQESSNVALGYNVRSNKIEKVAYYDLAAMGPAGDINSNASDMGNWLLTWLNKGKLGQQQILPEQYVMEAMSPQVIMPTGYLPGEEFQGMYSASYGFGWIITNYKGLYRVEHGGSIDGFRSTVVIFPNEKTGIVVLTNQTNYEPAMLIRNTIADLILDVKPTDWLKVYIESQEENQPGTNEIISLPDPVPEITINSNQFEALVGNYLHPGYGRIEIFLESDSLYTWFRRRKLKIVPTATEHVFHAIHIVSPYSRAMPPLEFKKNEKGETLSLIIQFEPEIKAIEFIRGRIKIK